MHYACILVFRISFLDRFTNNKVEETANWNPRSINMREFLLINALFSIDKVNRQKNFKNPKKFVKCKKCTKK